MKMYIVIRNVGIGKLIPCNGLHVYFIHNKMLGVLSL